MMAPEAQTHVPAILWVGQHFDYQLDQVKPYQNEPLSHDDLFCSILVAFELGSESCKAKENMLMQNLDIQAALKKAAQDMSIHG